MHPARAIAEAGTMAPLAKPERFRWVGRLGTRPVRHGCAGTDPAPNLP